MKQKFETKPPIKETLRKAKTKDNRYKNKKIAKRKRKKTDNHPKLKSFGKERAIETK